MKKLFQIGDLVKLRNRPYIPSLGVVTKVTWINGDEPSKEHLFKEVEVLFQDTLKYEEFYFSELEKVT